ncbi:hypothetical protein KXV85_005010, partial [Aspergillus fumigatus]
AGRGREGDETPRQRRHRVPERAAAALAQHSLQRDAADRHEGPAARQVLAARQGAAEARRPRRLREEAAVAAFRRHAAARLDLPGAGARPQDHADGRAVRRARPADPRRPRRRLSRPAPEIRADHGHDHARHDRGDPARRPHRGAAARRSAGGTLDLQPFDRRAGPRRR